MQCGVLDAVVGLSDEGGLGWRGWCVDGVAYWLLLDVKGRWNGGLTYDSHQGVW